LHCITGQRGGFWVQYYYLQEDVKMSDNFDVITHALQEHRAKLWKLTQSNMNSDMFNIMDQIRLEQIDTLDKEIAKRNILAGEFHHTDKGYVESTHEKQAEFSKNRNYTYGDRE
jgi:hypothetical protein